MSGGIVIEASPEHIAYAFLGCFIIVFGLVSLFVKEKLFISEACKFSSIYVLDSSASFPRCPSLFYFFVLPTIFVCALALLFIFLPCAIHPYFSALSLGEGG
jgi:hypothetical protein